MLLEQKALKAIEVLAAKRATWSVMTHGQLTEVTGHPYYRDGEILNRVGAWCRRHGKRSLALLVIRADTGQPSEGMFQYFRSDLDPVTRQNYEQQRLRLWQEDWSELPLPTTVEEIAEAYGFPKVDGSEQTYGQQIADHEDYGDCKPTTFRLSPTW